MSFEEDFPGLTKHELYSLAVNNGYSDAETKELEEMFMETCLDKKKVLEVLHKVRLDTCCVYTTGCKGTAGLCDACEVIEMLEGRLGL